MQCIHTSSRLTRLSSSARVRAHSTAQQLSATRVTVGVHQNSERVTPLLFLARLEACLFVLGDSEASRGVYLLLPSPILCLLIQQPLVVLCICLFFCLSNIMPAIRPRTLAKSYRALMRESRTQSLVRKYGTVSAAPAQAATPPKGAFENAIEAEAPRNTWTREEIKEIYETPLMKLAFAAVSLQSTLYLFSLIYGYQGTVHRKFHNPAAIQMCTLMNIKTGGCSEDCSYVSILSVYRIKNLD